MQPCKIVSLRFTARGEPVENTLRGYLVPEDGRFTIFDLERKNRLVYGMTQSFMDREKAAGRLIVED
jgi:hypothetical protein